jgi:hypothetical protein
MVSSLTQSIKYSVSIAAANLISYGKAIHKVKILQWFLKGKIKENVYL